MKHTNLFEDFMRDVVNLNATRISTLEDRVGAIKNFLRNHRDDYGTSIRRFTPQGSWAHKTIIRPPQGRNEFDADLIMIIDEVDSWQPKEYVNALYRVFRKSDRYSEKISRQSRCVTIDYAGDFHLDVVPCIKWVDELGRPRFWVLNRNTNQKEETASEAYTEWLKGQNRIAGKNMVLKVIRLAKYLRDIKMNFSVKSILLTTLLGSRITESDRLDRNPFVDMPTSLHTLFARLDDWLQCRPSMPNVFINPVLPIENLNRHWDQNKYTNFREKIHMYRDWIDEAYNENNKSESIRKWRQVLGEEFGKSVAANLSESTENISSRSYPVNADLVPGVTSGSISFASIPIWSHVKQPQWSMRCNGSEITIVASVHKTKYGPRLSNLCNGHNLSKGQHLQFKACYRHSIPNTFHIVWQIVNSGQEAINKGDLRGNFEYDETRQAVRWESTAYRGVHWIQAFLINAPTQECVARSDRFFVVVE